MSGGQTGAITVQARALNTFSGFVYINTGYISGGNTHSVSIPFIPFMSNLEIQKTMSTGVIYAGDTITYTLTYMNHGPDVATGTIVMDVLGSGMTLSGSIPAFTS